MSNENQHLHRGRGCDGSCAARGVPADIFGVTVPDAETLCGADTVRHSTLPAIDSHFSVECRV